jgi:hypothetical protein
MQLGNHTARPNWGHLVFVTAMFGICIAYLFDVVHTSTNAQNLLLPVPATFLAAIFYLAVVIRELQPAEGARQEAAPAGRHLDWTRLRTPLLMALVGAYLLAISWTGFDVSTFLFIAASLAVQGERRIVIVLAYSAVFATLVVLGMRMLLPFPLPTLVL